MRLAICFHAAFGMVCGEDEVAPGCISAIRLDCFSSIAKSALAGSSAVGVVIKVLILSHLEAVAPRRAGTVAECL